MDKGFLGIELGEKYLRYVYVTKQKGIATLSKAGQIEANLNFNSEGVMTQALKTIIQLQGLRPQRVFLTMSRRDTLIHQQLMPRMSNKELDEVVPGEVEKIPFFYNQSFEYYFKTFPHSREKERVVMVAIADLFLRSAIEEVDALKFYFRDIEVAPLNLKEILPAQRLTDRCMAFLVVQELCSYFCIYKGHNFLGMYKSPIGMEQILANVTDDNREYTLANWAGEFERVVKSHLVENPNSPIEHLWIVAEKGLADVVAERLMRRLDINTEVLTADKIRNLNMASDVEWNPIYSLALTPVLFHVWSLKPIFALDHFFANFRIQKYMFHMILQALIFVSALGIGLSGLNYFVNDNIAALKKDNQRIAFSIANLNKESKNLFSQKNDYVDVRKKLLAQAGYVQEINRTSWTRVLAAVANELPSDLALTGFRFNEDGNVSIKGDTYDITTIANLIRKINDSSILEGGKFEFLNEKKEQEVKLFNFGVQANLKGIKDSKNGQEKN